MIFGSVCSGIEAASVAWHPLGWRPAFFSEIEAFPCALLKHHYPGVPNHGDMTKFKEWPDATLDVLVGGTPCQSFSVAGLRKGLDDPRGNLTLVYLALAARYRPRWLVWENVPGVLSDRTGAFGAFLGGLAELGYGFAYRILDAQHFGVPQRRRRVFVVGCAGGWQRAAAVLFERHSLQGNPAPSREAREGVAGAIGARTGRSVGAQDAGCGHMIPQTVGALTDGAHMGGGSTARTPIPGAPSLSRCLNAGGMGRQDYETETLIPTTGGGFDVIPIQNATRGKSQNGLGVGGEVMYTLDDGSQHAVAHSLRADGFFDAKVYQDSEFGVGEYDSAGSLRAGRIPQHQMVLAHALRGEGFDASEDASEDGTGRGTPLGPVAFDTTQITSAANYSNPQPGDPCHPLASGAHPPAIAYTLHGADKTVSTATETELAGSIRTKPPGSIENSSTTVALSLAIRGRDGTPQAELGDDKANAVLTPNGGRAGVGVGAFMQGMQVRRLTPRECERLQGFPDDYTLVPYRNKPAADGPRYKALGNSMAVPVMSWIGQRIALVDAIKEAA